VTARKPSNAQLRALRHYAEGDGAGESWAQATSHDNLSWYRHERTIESLERHGWVDANGITAAGEQALRGAKSKP
jgi:hypothetical protein